MGIEKVAAPKALAAFAKGDTLTAFQMAEAIGLEKRYGAAYMRPLLEGGYVDVVDREGRESTHAKYTGERYRITQAGRERLGLVVKRMDDQKPGETMTQYAIRHRIGAQPVSVFALGAA